LQAVYKLFALLRPIYLQQKGITKMNKWTQIFDEPEAERKLTEAALGYIEQLPGMWEAMAIGMLGKVESHYTLSEMLDKLGICLTASQTTSIEITMQELSLVLMQTPPPNRVTRIGNVSYTAKEYHGAMFPILLQVLKSQNIYYG
jgi:hypothetical protein